MGVVAAQHVFVLGFAVSVAGVLSRDPTFSSVGAVMCGIVVVGPQRARLIPHLEAFSRVRAMTTALASVPLLRLAADAAAQSRSTQHARHFGPVGWRMLALLAVAAVALAVAGTLKARGRWLAAAGAGVCLLSLGGVLRWQELVTPRWSAAALVVGVAWLSAGVVDRAREERRRG